MKLHHVILPQFHNQGPNLPLVNVGTLRAACTAAGHDFIPIDLRFSRMPGASGPSVRLDCREHVGELVDLIYLCAIVEAYRRGEDLEVWRIPKEVHRDFVLHTGGEDEGLISEVNALYECGLRAAAICRKAKVVSATAYVSNLIAIIVFVLRLRQLSEAKVIIGGPSVTQSLHTRRFLLISRIADFLIIGDGEKLIVELLDCLQAGKPLNSPSIQESLSDLDSSPWHIERSLREFSKLPFPSYDHIDWTHSQPFAVTVEASRGCPAACSFCSEHKLHGKLQWREPEDVIQHLAMLRSRFGITRAYFVDSTFNFRQDWLCRFCDEMIPLREKKAVPVWACQLRGDLNESMVPQLYSAGLRACNVGVESFDDGVLRKMQKGTSGVSCYQVIKTLLMEGVEVSVNQVIGFPGETKEAFYQSLDSLIELINWAESESLLSALNVNMAAFHVRPGAKVYSSPASFGVSMSSHTPETWSFPVSLDLLQLSRHVPFRFSVDQPDNQTRLRRRTLFIHEISRRMRAKRSASRQDWRTIAVLEGMMDDHCIQVPHDVRIWSTLEQETSDMVYHCHTWFGPHPLMRGHVEALQKLTGHPMGVSQAVERIHQLFPNNSTHSVRIFLAHMLSRGVLRLVDQL
jgi:hypothetical protein